MYESHRNRRQHYYKNNVVSRWETISITLSLSKTIDKLIIQKRNNRATIYTCMYTQYTAQWEAEVDPYNHKRNQWPIVLSQRGHDDCDREYMQCTYHSMLSFSFSMAGQQSPFSSMLHVQVSDSQAFESIQLFAFRATGTRTARMYMHCTRIVYT